MPVAIVVPSKLTFKFLKPASCSTLELKGLIGSPKNLLVHMISGRGLRLEGQHTDWKPCLPSGMMPCHHDLLSLRREGRYSRHSKPPHVSRRGGRKSVRSYWEQGKLSLKGERTLLVSRDLKKKMLFLADKILRSWFNHPVCPSPIFPNVYWKLELI